MTHHKTTVAIDLSHERLASLIADLRYDALGELLYVLAGRIREDGFADEARGRPVLAGKLHKMSEALEQVGVEAEKIWTLCKPHVENGKKAWKL